MFKKLFSKKSNIDKTGIYKIEDKKLIEFIDIPSDGSINSIIESLGYPTNLVHVILTFNSKKIECFGCKILAKDIVFVLAKDKKTELTFSDISHEINLTDWNYEYSSFNITQILNDAIEANNLTIEFLKSVLPDLLFVKNDLYKSKKLGLFFYFENNILISFTSIE